MAGWTSGGPGQDHPVAAVLALAAASVVAGMKDYTAIIGWAADVPPAVLAGVYLRSGAPPRRRLEDHDLAGADRLRRGGI